MVVSASRSAFRSAGGEVSNDIPSTLPVNLECLPWPLASVALLKKSVDTTIPANCIIVVAAKDIAFRALRGAYTLGGLQSLGTHSIDAVTPSENASGVQAPRGCTRDEATCRSWAYGRRHT